ncbi:CHRD domain-containing protein [Roseateles sp.]|uniref:CHRD domain-containing protein n=1 Tax=Roseateles sp. TaxID=1971397 RepID=UPI0039E8112A
MPRVALFALSTLALALALPVAAHDTVYVGTLAGSKEAPANASPGTGSVVITFNDHDSTMRVQFDYAGLIGTSTAAHIHCCTVAAETGTAGVATTTPTFTGMVLGLTSGSYDHTFDMTLASSYNPAFLNNASTYNGNTALAFAGLMDGIANGKAYLNVHSNAFPGGEIRTFLQLAPVPEPGTYALMLSGLGVLAMAARRRQG